jgi:cytoskeletal protein CcmA (bactofilin family)
MAQELINIGNIANDGTGDTIRGAGIKINNNFTELYANPLATTTLGFLQNEISSTASNADIVLKPSGTGSVVFPAIRFNDNNIEGTRTNDDIKFIPSGSGQLVIDGLGFSGTSISASDSSTININENLIVDGGITASGLTVSGAVDTGSTVSVTGATTLSTLTVSGASSFAGTVTVDNLTFNDNIIATSSNADLDLTPGGTGVVNFSNLTIDSSMNFTDNVIKVTRSNDDFVLSGNGTGSTQIAKVDINGGAVDNTVIGGTTPAAGTFSTVAITDPTVTADGVTITDNTVKANSSNDDLRLAASGTGNVIINEFSFPNTPVAGQFVKTDASKNLSLGSFTTIFVESDVSDGTDTITGNSTAQTFDTFAHATYRSAKYTIQISDATANRFAVVEANVTHDGSNAYISTTGGADNGTGDGSTVYDPLEFTAIISGSDVRVRAKVNNTNSHVLKFVRRIIKV